VSDGALQPARGSARVAEYDLVRLVAIILVVLIHVIAPFARPADAAASGPDAAYLASRAVRFAVPAFVMLTGVLVWTRPRGGGHDGWVGFFVRRLKTIVVPYLFWSAVFIVAGTVLVDRDPGSIRQVIRGLVLGTTWYHLYFVPVIVGVYALAPVASAAYRRWSALPFVISLPIGVYVPILIAERGLSTSAPYALVSLVCAYLPYAAGGAWYARIRSGDRGRTVETRTWPIALLGGLALRLWFTLSGEAAVTREAASALTLLMNMLASIGLVGLASVIVSRGRRVGEASVALAPAVFGVYLMHPLVLLILERAAVSLFGALPGPGLWTLVVWPALTAACLVIAVWATRYPGLWWAHGASQPASLRIG